MRRHQLRSTVMTSNRQIGDWDKLIGDVPAATAILDRFLQQAEVITITGKSYRIASRLAKKQACTKGKHDIFYTQWSILIRPQVDDFEAR